MYPVYRNMINAHALKALTERPTMPNVNLAIGGDDEMSNVPLLIFRDQHLQMPQPVYEKVINLPYEKTAAKGAGDTLSMDNFVTDDFNLGVEYDFLT